MSGPLLYCTSPSPSGLNAPVVEAARKRLPCEVRIPLDLVYVAFVPLRFVPFRAVPFRVVPFRFVLCRFVCAVSCRFVTFRLCRVVSCRVESSRMKRGPAPRGTQQRRHSQTRQTDRQSNHGTYVCHSGCSQHSTAQHSIAQHYHTSPSSAWSTQLQHRAPPRSLLDQYVCTSMYAASQSRRASNFCKGPAVFATGTAKREEPPVPIYTDTGFQAPSLPESSLQRCPSPPLRSLHALFLSDLKRVRKTQITCIELE